uniref:Uncharacterized protein n=1 Tax=Bionectria ochroleuca TaxID=29856 RepID=A0A0B7JTK9_BIOOC
MCSAKANNHFRCIPTPIVDCGYGPPILQLPQLWLFNIYNTSIKAADYPYRMTRDPSCGCGNIWASSRDDACTTSLQSVGTGRIQTNESMFPSVGSRTCNLRCTRQNAIVAIRNARCRPRFCHSVPLVQDPATKPVPHVQQLLGLDSVRPWSNLVCTDGVSSHVRVHIGASASACCSHVCIRISAVSLQGELEGKVEKTHGLERLLLPGASHHDAPRQNR